MYATRHEAGLRPPPPPLVGAVSQIAFDHGPALRRDRPGGTIEVATVRGRKLVRELVDAEGRVAEIASLAQPRQLVRLRAGYWALNILVFAVALYLRAWLLALVAIPFLTMAVRWLLMRRGELEYRLRASGEAVDEWTPAFALQGWAPRTFAQWRAVERLAAENGERALVQRLEDGSVDVVVVDSGAASWYRVAPSGDAATYGHAPGGARWRVSLVILGVFVVLWVGEFIIWTFAPPHLVELLFLVAFAAMLVVWAIAALVQPSSNLAKRARRLGVPGATEENVWFELRRNPPSDGE